MRGKNVLRLNATAAGGGVAIINESWVDIHQQNRVNAHWGALEPDPKAAEVTKWMIHNILQGVDGPADRLTADGIAIYDSYIARNLGIFKDRIQAADVIWIDDWQPSGLIPYILGGEIRTSQGVEYRKGLNPKVPIILEDHIQTLGKEMVTPGTPQYEVWDFLWNRNRIRDVHAFLTHPKDEFVPPNVPDEKVVFFPAAVDELGDLLRELTPLEEREGFAFINQALWENGRQSPINPDDDYGIFIARFDESKNMAGGLAYYARMREMCLETGMRDEDISPLLMLGNGSVDDPSGKLEFEKIMTLLDGEFAHIKPKVKVARVKHNDVALNAVLGRAKYALQPSIREGFEARVTDAIMKGVIVLGSDQGGIPLQIVDGESGWIIPPGDTDQWAGRMKQLLTDHALYDRMKAHTKQHAKGHNYKFTTVPSNIRSLQLCKMLLEDKDGFQGNRRWVDEFVDDEEMNGTFALTA